MLAEAAERDAPGAGFSCSFQSFGRLVPSVLIAILQTVGIIGLASKDENHYPVG